jgi:Tfp pilus assembly protein PilN
VTRATLLVEVGPGRLQAGLWRSGKPGTLSPVHTVLFDESIWEGAWKDGLRALDAPLREAVAGLGLPVGNLETIGFYHSPTAVAEVFSCAGAGRASSEAALLALGDAAGFALEENPHDHAVLCVDPARGLPTGTARQTHRLICADTDASASAVTAWLERAGLHVQAIAPMPAAHIRSLIEEATSSEHEGATVMLRIGEHRSQLTASVSGRIRLVRHVSLDIHTLTQALTMPMTVRTGPGATDEVRLTPEEARAVLFRVGIPDRDSVIDAQRGITGSAALPLLQPVLQRAVVEMRQSLRFGLEEPERATARLVIVGPGAEVPNLGEMMAAQLHLTAALPRCPGKHRTDLEEAGAQAARLGINLLPYGSALEQGVRRVKVALLAGVALAAAYAGIEGGTTWAHTRQMKQKIAALEGPTREAREFMEGKERLALRDGAMSALNRSIDRAVGQGAPWSAWLAELASMTPESVKLRDITMTAESGPAKCELRGVVRGVEGARADIGAFVTRLEKSPLVAQVTLGATQRAGAGGEAGGVDFQTSVTLLKLPLMDVPAAKAPATAQAGDPNNKEATP